MPCYPTSHFTPSHTIPTQHNATPHHTTSHHITSHHTTPHHITPHVTTPRHTTPHITIHHITPHHLIHHAAHHNTSHHTTPSHPIPSRDGMIFSSSPCPIPKSFSYRARLVGGLCGGNYLPWISHNIDCRFQDHRPHATPFLRHSDRSRGGRARILGADSPRRGPT